VRLGFCLIWALLSVTAAQAQTPLLPPSFTPPQPSQATIQSQQLLSCTLGCDTRAGQCQGVCSQANTPLASFPLPNTPATSIRPDPGALAQCFLNCSSVALVCKQACTTPVTTGSAVTPR
jgi:hypothetical protein